MRQSPVHQSYSMGMKPTTYLYNKYFTKIYDYFAVDLLSGRNIQTLQVEPNVYDHIHMMFLRADTDTIQGIQHARCRQ